MNILIAISFPICFWYSYFSSKRFWLCRTYIWHLSDGRLVRVHAGYAYLTMSLILVLVSILQTLRPDGLSTPPPLLNQANLHPYSPPRRPQEARLSTPPHPYPIPPIDPEIRSTDQKAQHKPRAAPALQTFRPMYPFVSLQNCHVRGGSLFRRSGSKVSASVPQ